MWNLGIRGRKRDIICANDQCPQRRFPARETLFVCRLGTRCPQFGKQQSSRRPEELLHWPSDVLFKPKRYAFAVPCPADNEYAVRKVCPYCFTEQPTATGRSSTIAVIGASVSGKTCFITSLIRLIERELAQPVRMEMSLEWEDQKGYQYYKDCKDAIFGKGAMPESNRKEIAPVKMMDITVKFPIRRRWKRWRCLGKDAVASLIFPDPAGEIFENLDDPYYLDYLSHADALILMVDPFGIEEHRATLNQEQRSESEKITDAEVALRTVIKNVRDLRYRGKQKKLDIDLAVVVTKCDVPNVIDLDDSPYNIAPQGRWYNPQQMERASKYVEDFLALKLQIPNLVNLAKRNFRQARFFSVTALGSEPKKVSMNGTTTKTLTQPAAPRHVEDPLLWILHRWGYI